MPCSLGFAHKHHGVKKNLILKLNLNTCVLRFISKIGFFLTDGVNYHKLIHTFLLLHLVITAT